MIETKVAAGSFAGVVTGLLTWALVTYIPAFRDGIPEQLAPFIPVVAAWLCSTAAAYMAPHTHRPDLPPAVLRPASPPERGGYPAGDTAVEDLPSPPQSVTVTPPPPARLTP